MKNITVSLDDETYRRARVAAAEEGRSVSAIVREHLQSYSAEPTAHEKRVSALRKLFAEMDARGIGIDASSRLKREELYEAMTSERSG